MSERRIIKTSQVTPLPTTANVLNEQSSSTTDTYSANYINNNVGKEIYSTTEQVVGTWIDGKPLYGKIIIVSPPSTGDTGEDIYTEDTEDIKFFKGYLLGQNLTKYGLNLYISANDTIYTFIGNRGHSLHQKVSNYQTYLNATNYIWIEYTKTTD